MRDGANVLAHGACETIIKVSLGERSYPIALGDKLLPDAGQWIAASLPGARCALWLWLRQFGLHIPSLSRRRQEPFAASGHWAVARRAANFCH